MDEVTKRRKPWAAPVVEPLPRLTKLTLATTFGPGVPGEGGGGSTVIP